MSATLRGWFASRLSIGKARKCLLLQRCTGGFEWVGSVWFNFKKDGKSTVALGKDRDQFIFPEDFAFHQKNVDVYIKQVEDGAPVVVAGAPLERRGGVYPDMFAVHLWGSQHVVRDLLAGASANLIWIVVGVVVGAAVTAAVLLGLIQTGVFNPKIVAPSGSPVPLVLPF